MFRFCLLFALAAMLIPAGFANAEETEAPKSRIILGHTLVSNPSFSFSYRSRTSYYRPSYPSYGHRPSYSYPSRSYRPNYSYPSRSYSYPSHSYRPSYPSYGHRSHGHGYGSYYSPRSGFHFNNGKIHFDIR
jgi:hypothetical protein